MSDAERWSDPFDCPKCEGRGEFRPNLGGLFGSGSLVCDVCEGEGLVQRSLEPDGDYDVQ